MANKEHTAWGSWRFSVLRTGQVGIQVLLKASQFTHRQNECIRNCRISELVGLDGTSGEPGVFGGSDALFMEKVHLFSFVLGTTTGSRPIGRRGTLFIYHPCISPANTSTSPLHLEKRRENRSWGVTAGEKSVQIKPGTS